MMVVIFIFSSIPGDEIPKYKGLWDYVVKKSGHMLEFGLLAVTMWRAQSPKSPITNLRSLISTLLFTTLYAVSDEFHQLFTPGRTGRPTDVMIDVMGACLGLAVYFVALFIRQTRSQTPRPRPTRPPA